MDSAINASIVGRRYLFNYSVQIKLSSLPKELHMHYSTKKKTKEAGETFNKYKICEHPKKDEEKGRKTKRANTRYGDVCIIRDLQII